MRPFFFFLFLSTILTTLFLTGCETLMEQSRNDRRAIDIAIARETPGDYYIGRRFYKVDYHMWGWVKKPGEPWKKARLVMLNEQQQLAPDRLNNKIGSDNNYEYRLYGNFTGDQVYEPASNSFYPEFRLKKALLIRTDPPLIFPDSRWIEPRVRLLQPPQY